MKLNVIRFLLCFIISSPLYGSTHITLNDNEVSFNTRPRLAEVLSSVALQEDWYWPASALHINRNKELIALRDDILLGLNKMLTNAANNTDYHHSISSLITEIQSWKLAERITLKIDYDMARINSSLNPLFEEASYTLNLVKRRSYLHLFGAVQSTEMLPHKPAVDVSEYRSTLYQSGLADPDYFYIIQPDGKFIQAAYAYWNKGHQEIMPGSQLYIPFKKYFFSNDNQKLNEKIVFLATNRILP